MLTVSAILALDDLANQPDLWICRVGDRWRLTVKDVFVEAESLDKVILAGKAAMLEAERLAACYAAREAPRSDSGQM